MKSTAVPEAISGTKDEVDDDGKPCVIRALTSPNLCHCWIKNYTRIRSAYYSVGG